MKDIHIQVTVSRPGDYKTMESASLSCKVVDPDKFKVDISQLIAAANEAHEEKVRQLESDE